MSPASGTGASQSFTFTYSDPDGYQDLALTYMLFNSTLNGANACFVFYNRPGNLLYLVNDAGTGTLSPALLRPANLLGPITPGSGSVSNTHYQCTLNGVGSSASGAGNNLTLTVDLTFLAAFGGLKNIYGLAVDSGSLNSNWQTLGTWSRAANQAPTTVSVTPASGSGLTQAFSFVYSDPDGYTDLSVIYALVNSSLNGANACFFFYNRPANQLYLVNDAGNGLVAGSITPGGAGSLSNTQCILSSGGAATGVSTNLTVPVSVTFKSPAFSGAKNVFMLATDAAGANSGWVTKGTWTVP